MSDPDEGYAALWLAELGAWCPEWRDGAALAPRTSGYGLDLPPHERAAAAGDRLRAEPLRARRHRARNRPDRSA